LWRRQLHGDERRTPGGSADGERLGISAESLGSLGRRLRLLNVNCSQLFRAQVFKFYPRS
jgi:hypothetical protein